MPLINNYTYDNSARDQYILSILLRSMHLIYIIFSFISLHIVKIHFAMNNMHCVGGTKSSMIATRHKKINAEFIVQKF